MNNNKKNKCVHLGDYNYSGCKKNNDNIDIQKKIDLILMRLNRIEESLAPTNIIKATPIMSIIAGDMKCLNKINDIYEKWITFISSVANSELQEYNNVEQLFWQLDRFIFENYFSSTLRHYLFEFVDLDLIKISSCTPEQVGVINIAFSKDRDEKFKLLHPPHKEFISSTVIRDKTVVFLVYFGKELYNIVNYDINNNNKTDYHFSDGKLHSALSLNNDVIGGGSGFNSVNVNMSDDTLDFLDIKDKRRYILGNKRPLMNNLVDVIPLNKFNSSLYRFSPMLLNLSLVIFHAMLHIKRDLSNDNVVVDHRHDSLFTKEYLNYTPSALYGHSMLPMLTLPQ